MSTTTTDLPQLLSAAEVAKWLGVSKRSVQDWARAGDLPARRLGGSWFFPLPALQAWAEQQGGTSHAETPET